MVTGKGGQTATGNTMHPGTTVGFYVVIDRQSVSAPIVRKLRDGWTTINRCVSVLRTYPHMYPRISARLDVYGHVRRRPCVFVFMFENISFRLRPVLLMNR